MLQTERLQLRQWRHDDFLSFAKLNADPDVMAHFPKTLSHSESDAMANKIKKLITDKGWGLWALSLRLPRSKSSNNFIGFVGLHEPSNDLPCSPCIEISWRLHKQYWGKGYATEAAKEVLRFAFTQLALDEVVSFTATTNLPSQAVMQRIGMTNTGKNFNHPAIALNHRLSEHVLYRITKAEWLNAV